MVNTIMNKKAYIQPEQHVTHFTSMLMQVPESFPQGNGDDPVIDDEGDELGKRRHDGWGNLW